MNWLKKKFFKKSGLSVLQKLEKDCDKTARVGRRISAGLAAIAIAIFISWVDLNPEVDPNFFFSSNDPELQTQEEILKIFPDTPLIILSAVGDLRSPTYLEKIEALTKALREVEGILSVYSLTQGPKNLEDVRRSPFWSRILLAENGKASNLFVFVRNPVPEELIHQVESIKNRFDEPSFALILSGVPYVTELIRRNLFKDLRVFSLAAFLIFGVVLWRIFHSLRMVFGTILACVSAATVTLIISQLLEIRIGLLTANLITIIFVLTLSHILFLSFNWRHLLLKAAPEACLTPFDAARRTLEPSFWSMATTFLGFISLLLVQAIPLRNLGISGAIGTVMAFLAAFGIYLWFLPHPEAVRHNAKRTEEDKGVAQRFFDKRRLRFTTEIALLCLILSTGIASVNTDPSLLSYFREGSPLRKGLSFVDRNLGSSPLQLVVRDPKGKKLSSSKAFRKLWNLHSALERDPAVGSAVSLPLIMAEAQRVPFASLLPYDWLFQLMELSGYKEVSRQFLTEDRQRGYFFLLMREGDRGKTSRLETTDRIRQIVKGQGLEPDLLGGIYVLQGRMAELVTSSLVTGLITLLAFFFIMAWFLSRSFQVAIGVLISLCLIPMWMLGLIGYLGIPFDVISSPAVNIAIAMGLDAMIHLLVWVRRHCKVCQGKISWEGWVEARTWLWRPIVYSAAIVCAGFGIFGFSAFPPTQRFGFAIVIGTVMAPLAALFVLPLVGSPKLAEEIHPKKIYQKLKLLIRGEGIF